MFFMLACSVYLVSVLCILYFCFVCIVSPFVYSCLSPIFVQLYRLVPPGVNLLAVNKYHIITGDFMEISDCYLIIC